MNAKTKMIAYLKKIITFSFLKVVQDNLNKNSFPERI